MTDGAGGLSDVPWASVFDPAVNVRALGEIQARGFRAASELVDRFVHATGPAPTAGDVDTDEPVEGPHRNETISATTLPEAERLLASWKSLVGQVIGSLRDSSVRAWDAGATFDLAAAKAAGQVELVAAAGHASAEVWLHNAGPVELGEVRLRCSDLLSHEGTVISSSVVRFEPETVPMVARSSRGVSIEIDMPDGVPAGCYRGMVLADGHDDLWLPLLVTFRPHTP